MTYRLWHTQRMNGKQPTPMLSANDRSRWVTVRSLLERGSYEIEFYTTDPVMGPQWNTIDKVMHHGRDGRLHEYSSKPPLLATLLAGPTWVIQQMTGWSFQSDLFHLVQTTLWFCQILPLILTLGYFAWLLHRMNLSAGTQFFLVAAAAWGTYITTFATSLNNHHFAVLGVYWTLFALIQIGWLQSRAVGWYLVLGLSAAFTAANELPALSFFCLTMFVAATIDIRKFLLVSLPAAAIVGFAAFGTTLVAHQSIRPPYAHRSDGAAVVKLPLEVEDELESNRFVSQSLRASLNRHRQQLGWNFGPNSVAELSRFPPHRNEAQRWVIRDYFQLPWSNYQWHAIALVRPENADYWEVRKWDNWYDYPGSYWHDGDRQGVDVGEPSRANYTVQCLVGHHGIFSLTPVWLLTVIGLCLGLVRDPRWKVLAGSTILLSVVVIGFYLLRPQLDRNYGGQCSALRWVFWLSPLWILTMAPAVSWLNRSHWGRWFCGTLLVLSAASALIPTYNPWVHPWLYQWWIAH